MKILAKLGDGVEEEPRYKHQEPNKFQIIN
jgi:hypothetical protein